MVRFVLGLALVLVFAPSVEAQGLQGIRISPAFLEVELSHGESREVPITIENLTHETVELSLSAIDFRQANEEGGITFLGSDAANYSYALASFLSFETSSVTLAAGAAEEVIVTVENRPDLSPGGHYAAFIGSLANVAEEDLAASVRPAVSSLMLVKKTGGEVFALSLLETNWPDTIMMGLPDRQMEITFQNEGNIHVIPYGTVTITDMLGRRIMRGTINNNSSVIFPESRRRIDVALGDEAFILPVSFLTLDITGRDSLDKVTFVYRQTVLYVHPWTPVVIVGIIVSGLVGRRIYRRQHATN